MIYSGNRVPAPTRKPVCSLGTRLAETESERERNFSKGKNSLFVEKKSLGLLHGPKMEKYGRDFGS